MAMWDSVRAGEEKYIFPYQEKADVMFNSSLLYEIAVLKKYAYPMLKSIPQDSPYYTRSRRLVKFLNYFKDCGDEKMCIRDRAYFVAIPTSSGTGSEVTPFAVITDDRTGTKYPLADYRCV